MKMTLQQIERDVIMIENIMSGKLENYTRKSDFELLAYYSSLIAYRNQLDQMSPVKTKK